MTQPSIVPISPAQEASTPWRERTLERLVQHVRAVLPVSAVVFLPAESSGARTMSCANGLPVATATNFPVGAKTNANGVRPGAGIVTGAPRPSADCH